MWIESLPSGKYAGCYRDRAGRRHKRSFPNRTMARRWASDQEALVRSGAHRDPNAGRVPLADYERRWWESRVAEAATRATDRGRLDKHVLPALGDAYLEGITPTMAQGWSAGSRV